MANPERGEAVIEVGGKRYTLRPEFNACCELETQLNASFEDALKWIREGRLSGLRAVAWVMLHELHGDEIVTLRDAGAWIDRAGNTDRVTDAIFQALNINLTPRKAGRGRPRKARAGTGVLSLQKPAESA